jgi:hypothetical protein
MTTPAGVAAIAAETPGTLIRPSATFSRSTREKDLDGWFSCRNLPQQSCDACGWNPETLIRPSATFSRSTREKDLD